MSQNWGTLAILVSSEHLAQVWNGINPPHRGMTGSFEGPLNLDAGGNILLEDSKPLDVSEGNRK